MSKVSAPPHQVGSFSGSRDTLQEMVRVVQGPRGERSLLVRNLTEAAIGKVFPKDYLGEILAINYFVASRVPYVNDPAHVEMVKDPERIATEVISKGFARGDCDDIATMIATMCLQVGRISQFVVAGFSQPGNYTHVFTRVQEPRTKKWIVCDPVAGADVSGMLNRVKTYQIWSCDELPSKGPIISR